MKAQTIKTKVAGTTHATFNWDALKKGMELDWKRDPNNPHDPNCIMLINPVNQERIGFLSKHQAKGLAPWIDEGDNGNPVTMNILIADITGGKGFKEYRGINIEIHIGGIDTSQYFDLETIYNIA